MGRKRWPTEEKARKMLKDKTVRGKPLTPGQRGLFGLLAGGGTPTRVGKKGKRRGQRGRRGK